MDSKLIFIKSNKLLSKVVWEPTPDHGWQYCGRSGDLKMTLLYHVVSTYFPTDLVYFLTDRNNSKAVAKSEVVNLIACNIDKLQNMAFWNESFTKVIDFNTIGVFRVGEIFKRSGLLG
jgi:ABC-type molybdenum transport system ATPase subunit/photorepair protein PhrA